MKDLAYKKGVEKLSLKELREFSECRDVIYNIIMQKDTKNGYSTGVISARNLEDALEILKDEFEEESTIWLNESGLDHEEIQDYKTDRQNYYIEDTTAYLCIGDEYLYVYITANEVVKKEDKKFLMALKMVQFEDGLNKKEHLELLDKLLEEDEIGKLSYVPIEFYKNSTAAFGFIVTEYFESYNYDKTDLEKVIEPILEDSDLVRKSNIYTLLDGVEVYMSY